MSHVSGFKTIKLEKKVSSSLTMMKISGFMKMKTHLRFVVCSEESSAHVDCLVIKEKARANHAVVVVSDHIRTKERPKEKENLT